MGKAITDHSERILTLFSQRAIGLSSWIKIITGDTEDSVYEAVPIIFPKERLQGISDVLKRIVNDLELNSPGDDELITLHRPNDNDVAWRALLYHAAYPSHPRLEEELPGTDRFIHTYVLGLEFEIPALRDLAIKGLIDDNEQTYNKMGLPADWVAMAFKATAARSPLRMLLAEFVITRYESDPACGMEEYAGIPDFLPDLLSAQKRIVELGVDCFYKRDKKVKGCEKERWRAYMVSDIFKHGDNGSMFLWWRQLGPGW